MDVSQITFNDMPKVLAYLVNKVDRLETLLEAKQPAVKAADTNDRMNLKQLQVFHPAHPAAPTIYGWVRNGLIPHYKQGKQLFFKRSEIEKWLDETRQKTEEELEAEAINYINGRRNR